MRHGWRSRFGILLLSLTACLLCASKVQAQTLLPPVLPAGQAGASVSWDYDYPATSQFQTGFILYRALEAACDDPAQATIEVARTGDRTARMATDVTIVAGTERVCYEVSAYNFNGESPHSNRANALVVDLIPAMPGPLTVQALTE